MNDRIKSEEASAVEDSPALTPRSDLPQSPASRPGGSPWTDDIDDVVDDALKKGPYRSTGWIPCPNCSLEWHGFPHGSTCPGSHVRIGKGANAIRESSMGWPGDLSGSS